jgi:hypothetical protein
MKQVKLQHPDGHTVFTSLKGAEILRGRGYTDPEPAAIEEKLEEQTGDDNGGQGDDGGAGDEPPRADLPKKLGELVNYAETNNLFDEATIADWRKPGTKTADVRAAIEKKLEEQTAQ